LLELLREALAITSIFRIIDFAHFEMSFMPRSSICQFIDHAVLHPTQTDADLVAACELGRRTQVATVCVKPYMVARAVELLGGSGVGVSTVIGFPHGSTTTELKAEEARVTCRDGAIELDMVVNIARVLEQDWDYVARDIRAVVEAGREFDALSKVIFETSLLTADEWKIRLCEISERAGAAFVKTSTGFGFVRQADGSMLAAGATEHDVELMRKHCGPRVGVKAAGGIRSYADALRFVQLGATRLGTSATQSIAEQELDALRGEPVAQAGGSHNC
jgi:deoxyribose-phosphate aldolase